MMSFQSRSRDARSRSALGRQADDRRDPAEAESREGPPSESPAAGSRSGKGCIWDASSLDLMEGLEVTEHGALDTVPAEFNELFR